MSLLSVIDVVADGTTWQYQIMDEPGSELTCQVITEADDDNKTNDGQNMIYPLAPHQVRNLCTTLPHDLSHTPMQTTADQYIVTQSSGLEENCTKNLQELQIQSTGI